MQLVSVEVEGFKRFSSRSRLDLSNKIVALVGPNEAGKSSMLAAIADVVSGETMPTSFASRTAPGSPKLTAYFQLGDEDRRSLSDIEGGGDVRWWKITKSESGKRIFALTPTPKRDLTDRQLLGAELRELLENDLGRFLNRWEIVETADDDETNSETLARISNEMLSDEESLEPEDAEATRVFGAAIAGITVGPPSDSEQVDPDREDEWISALTLTVAEKMARFVEGDTPHRLAGRRLVAQLPEVLEFSGDDRDLRSTYELDEATLADPPVALGNICSLGGLDLSTLGSAIDGETGDRIVLIDTANALLKSRFNSAWMQSAVIPRLHLEGRTLSVVISVEDQSTFTAIEERSDGLRWFVALFAFLWKNEAGSKPILLIDEAEQHLHYDAQADLVRVLTEQELLSKVIYTTHSAGCLPDDLGRGVRPIEPIAGTQTSRIRKNLWADNAVGTSPLANAMGASSFAFLPSRSVLIAEGPSDALLLPSLFRDVLGEAGLKFKVCPGIATTRPESYRHLLTEGGCVAFIVDGDGDGDRYHAELVSAGVPKEALYSLKTAIGAGSVLEDIVHVETYRGAINGLLDDFEPNSETRLGSDLLPDVNRPQFLKDWLASNNLPELAKVDIASRVLASSLPSAEFDPDGDSAEHESANGPRPLVDPAQVDGLRQLAESIALFFEDATGATT